MIKNDTCLGTYSASTSIPSVLAAKCDSTTCTATATDVTTLKNCFTNPSSSACTGTVMNNLILYNFCFKMCSTLWNFVYFDNIKGENVTILELNITNIRCNHTILK